MFDKTGNSSIVIPVINVINGKNNPRDIKSENNIMPVENKAEKDKLVFKEMRETLLANTNKTETIKPFTNVKNDAIILL